MTTLDRRRFLTLLGAGAALGSLHLPLGAFAQPAAGSGAHVVIVGGGFGGATCAKYLRRADPTVRVTLIEKAPTYYTCPFSNKVVAGLMGLEALAVGYERLSREHAVEVVQGEVVELDGDARRVVLADGESLNYDRLVVAPGIDLRYDALEGYDPQVARMIPHAWKAGEQTVLLHRQLQAMEEGGTFIISVPPMPYRCPPGPYERASLVAWYLKNHNPRAKVLILDANDTFPKQALFEQGWQSLYPGMIERVAGSQGGRLLGVEAQAMAARTEAGRFSGAVVNVIPPEQAGAIARRAGLADETGWCPVDPRTFESTRQAGVHVIGDAARAGKLPKSAAAANAEAKVCALAVAALLTGESVGDPSFINACYSLLTPDYAISVAAVFELARQGIVPIPRAVGTSPLQASREYRQEEAEDAEGWYQSIVADSFA